MARKSAEKLLGKLDRTDGDEPPVEGAGTNTRQRLIETAARHFAEFGFEGASLRAIHREMGANPATTHYHFGSKLAVYEAIVEAYFVRIQSERQRYFEAIDPKLRGQARLEALLTAYVFPHLQVVAGESGDAYGRLIARNVVQNNWQGPDMIGALQPLRERFLGELGKLFPEASRTQIARSLSFAIMMMVTIPFDRTYEAMTGRVPRDETAEARTSAVVTFAAAGFSAACGSIS